MKEEKSVTNRHYLNNFDIIRFILACAVIIAHAVPLSNTVLGGGIYSIIARAETTLGAFAVNVFFILSGYMICASYINRKNFFIFIYARILRIFPALGLLILLTVIIIGPIVTTLSVSSYFTAPKTWEYCKIFLLFFKSPTLPGVEFSSGVFGEAINGSLWTLKYEFICYIFVAILGILRILNKKFVLFIYLLFLFANIFLLAAPQDISLYQVVPYTVLNSFLNLTMFFISGMMFYLFRDRIHLKFNLAVLLFSMICIFYYSGIPFSICFSIFGVYIIFYLSFSSKIRLYNFGKYGDFSYGIYIYGYLIQQLTVKAFGGKMSPIMNFSISLPIAIICGVLSWHIIEKRFLKLKVK